MLVRAMYHNVPIVLVCGDNRCAVTKPAIEYRSTVIKLFAGTYLDRRIMLLLMLHPLFPALIVCFPASVSMSLVRNQILIAKYTSPAMFPDNFFEFRISERSIFFFLNGIQNMGTFVIWRLRFPAAINAAVRHRIMSVTISDPVKSLKSHAV